MSQHPIRIGEWAELSLSCRHEQDIGSVGDFTLSNILRRAQHASPSKQAVLYMPRRSISSMIRHRPVMPIFVTHKDSAAGGLSW
jgi:hypothetical protein